MREILSYMVHVLKFSAEMAVTEILEALDGCEDKLQEARDAVGEGEDVGAALDEVSMELTSVMSALQFQDITSQ